MQRHTPFWFTRLLTVAGMLALIGGLLLIAAERTAIYAQDDEPITDEFVDDEADPTPEATPEAPRDLLAEPARYVGREECADCHRNLVSRHEDSAHGSAPVSFPDVTPEQFTAECAGCHVTGFDAASGEWEEDGVQCEACHGPGSNHITAVDDAGSSINDEEIALIRATINPAIDPQTCGQCHATGESPDGRPFPVGFMPGQPLTDSFTPAPPDDANHWYPTGHASHKYMQYNEWLNGGHARSLAHVLELSTQFGFDVQPECLTCHSFDYNYTVDLREAVEEGDREGDAPDLPTAETAQYGVTCVSCHDPHADPDDGEAFGLVAEGDALCAACHSSANFAELFPDGGANDNGIHHPVVEMWEGLPLIAEVPPEPNAHVIDPEGPTCATCHYASVPVTLTDGTTGERGSHTLLPILPGAALNVEGLTDTCSACHEDAATPEALQQLIDDIQGDMTARIEAARAAVTDTTPGWVIAALDFVEGDGSAGIHNYAYADALLDAVDQALGLPPPAVAATAAGSN